MKIYVVGGAVRDELLGLPVKDRDHVVVGATPEEMVRLGFKPVGKDFPVFLHPQTHEEYALARTERKSGRGYKGFAVYAAPDVTLEDDLRRRDLTINAIARAETGELIDPFNGRRDLEAKILRHVSDAFVEDPVRILRVARFAARLPFRIAEETLALMRRIVDSGEADALVAERVWQEFARGLEEEHPERMLEALERCGLRARLLPELERVPAPARFSGSRVVRFAHLCWDLDEAAVNALCDRLRVPNDEKELALLGVRLKKSLNVKSSSEVLNVLKRADAFRRPERFGQLLEAATLAAPGFERAKLDKALSAACKVDAGEIAKRASAPATIPALIDQAREQAIGEALKPGR